MARKYWSRKKLSYLKHTFLKSKYKPGGTTTIIRNTLNNKVTQSGQDLEGLGGWYFTAMEGKNKKRPQKVEFTSSICSLNGIGLHSSERFSIFFESIVCFR